MILNWLNKEVVSRLAKRATDILFLKNRVATSMGIMLGFFIQLIISAFRPLWENSGVVNFSNISIISYIFSGIFLCNAVALLYSHFHRNEADPEIEKALDFIERLEKEGKLNKTQAKLEYINLINKVRRNLEVKAPPDDDSKTKLPVKRTSPFID